MWAKETGDADSKVVNAADPYKWSGTSNPPAMGARVKVHMNGLGYGKVVGYFAEYGWLGVLVRLSKPPLGGRTRPRSAARIRLPPTPTSSDLSWSRDERQRE